MKDRDFLMWLHERLEYVHKENPHVDYMHKLRAVILATPPEQDMPNVAMVNNLDDVKAMLAKAPAPEAPKYCGLCNSRGSELCAECRGQHFCPRIDERSATT